jgi:predicted nuclease with TOPRIM domain
MKTIDEIEKIIQVTKDVLERKIDPFDVDVKSLIEKIKEIFPKLSSLEEYLKDSEAIYNLSQVIDMQSNEIYYKSSFLYFNPSLLVKKVQDLSFLELGNILSFCFYPILSTNFINIQSLIHAYEYWNNISYKKISFISKEYKIEEIQLEKVSKKIEDKIKSLEKYLNETSPIKLSEFIKDEPKNVAEKLFLLSFLIIQGKFYVGLNEEGIIIIQKNPSEIKGSIVFNVKI